LNRSWSWAGCLEYSWRHEALRGGDIGLRMRRLYTSPADDTCENGEADSSKIVGEALLRRVRQQLCFSLHCFWLLLKLLLISICCSFVGLRAFTFHRFQAH